MLDAVKAIVREVAEREVMPRFRKVAHERKADGSLLTAADLAAQDALARQLPAIADCPIVAEEMTRAEQRDQWFAGGGDVWCIDPIDGTSNFVNGLPYFAISVALLRAGRPVLGVTYGPLSDEMFYAEAGGGAWLNGQRLPIRQSPSQLGEALAGIDLKRVPRHLGPALAVRPPFHSQRNYGSSTLEWCYTAAGRFDVYFHGGQKLWDYAAGALILAEAGGHMCQLGQDEFWDDNLWHRSVIAANEATLFNAWKDWLRRGHGTGQSV